MIKMTNCRQTMHSLLLLLVFTKVYGWGNSNNNQDSSIFGGSRDWLYDGSSVSLKLEGCVWTAVRDGEDAGCLEESSEDGTTYWYQMSNCRRANAAFSLYSGNSCSSGNFEETMVSTGGVTEFVYYLSSYDANSPFNDDSSSENNNGGWTVDNLPLCEQTENGYIGMGCGSDGSFVLSYFNDQYCLSPTGSTYNNLNGLNKKLKQYSSCSTIYSNGDDSNAAQYLIAYAEGCSSLDSPLCTNDDMMNNALSSTSHSSGIVKSARVTTHKSWMTKLKYATAGLLLLASFIMFTGILFTNRRRRRALMQRRARHARQREDKSRRSAKSSRSKSRDGKSHRSSSKSHRSSSNRRSKSRDRETTGDGGVLT